MFCFPFLKVFCFFLCFSLRHGSCRSSSRPSLLNLGVGVRWDRRECCESAGHSSVKFAGRYDVSLPIAALSSPPAAAHSSPPVDPQSSSPAVHLSSLLAAANPSPPAAHQSSSPVSHQSSSPAAMKLSSPIAALSSPPAAAHSSLPVEHQSSQVTFIYIALLTIQIVSKHLTVSSWRIECQ